MDLAIALIRCGLTVVFATAGVTKLLDPHGTREAVKNFGVPNALAPAVSILLPLAELSIAACLLINATARSSSLGALLLLMLFTLVIAVNLAQGRKHDCHCFGQLHSEPLGWQTLVRNVVFSVAAGFVLWRSQVAPLPSVSETLIPLSVVQWLAIAAAIVASAVAFAFLRRRKRNRKSSAQTKLEGLPLNSLAPPFEIGAYDGGTVSLERLLDHRKPVLLIFTNPVCGPCVALFGQIKEWQDEHRDQLTIAIVSFGTIKENFVNVARNGLGQVLLQKRKGEVAEKYGATLTPTAVIVDTDGRIASNLAAGADEIRELLANLVGPVRKGEENQERSSVEVSGAFENV
jgi:uncharacterized membrane protein YphA (DoxX/SURF4 family)/peroxiredoxin